MRADLDELVKRAGAADNCPVVDFNMAGELDRVYKYAIVSDDAVVRHVNICHQETVLSDDRFELVVGAATYGDKLADDGVVSDIGFSFFTGKFQILRNGGDGGAGVYPNTLTHPCAIPDHCVGSDPTVVADYHVSLDRRKGFYDYVLSDLRFRMNISEGVLTHEII